MKTEKVCGAEEKTLQVTHLLVCDGLLIDSQFWRMKEPYVWDHVPKTLDSSCVPYRPTTQYILLCTAATFLIAAQSVCMVH